jgi:hypothetical protein
MIVSAYPIQGFMLGFNYASYDDEPVNELQMALGIFIIEIAW